MQTTSEGWRIFGKYIVLKCLIVFSLKKCKRKNVISCVLIICMSKMIFHCHLSLGSCWHYYQNISLLPSPRLLLLQSKSSWISWLLVTLSPLPGSWERVPFSSWLWWFFSHMFYRLKHTHSMFQLVIKIKKEHC